MKLNFVKIDNYLTVTSYGLFVICILLLAATKISGDTCLEGILLSLYTAFARDVLSLYLKRRALNRNGFEKFSR